MVLSMKVHGITEYFLVKIPQIRSNNTGFIRKIIWDYSLLNLCREHNWLKKIHKFITTFLLLIIKIFESISFQTYSLTYFTRCYLTSGNNLSYTCLGWTDSSKVADLARFEFSCYTVIIRCSTFTSCLYRDFLYNSKAAPSR